MARAPKTLDELFHDTLKDIYFAEKKILATLPKMAKALDEEEATDQALTKIAKTAVNQEAEAA